MINQVKNIRNLGLFYVLFSFSYDLGDTIFGIHYFTNTYLNFIIDITFLLICATLWFYFVKNISIFYEDKALEKINFIVLMLYSITYLSIFYMQHFNNYDGYSTSKIDYLYGIIIFVLFVLTFLIEILLLTIQYQLYKKTEMFSFLLYFVLSLFLNLLHIDVLNINIGLNLQLSDIVIFASEAVLLICVLQFYRQNTHKTV